MSSGRPPRPVRFDLGDLGRNSALGFHRVIGILQPQEVTLRQAEEFAQAQVRIAGDAARSVYDGVNAIARHADRMSELVLAHADLVEDFFLQNLAGMGIAKLNHDCALHFLQHRSVVICNLNVHGILIGPSETDTPLIVDPIPIRPSRSPFQRFEPIAGRMTQVFKVRLHIELAQLSKRYAIRIKRRRSS